MTESKLIPEHRNKITLEVWMHHVYYELYITASATMPKRMSQIEVGTGQEMPEINLRNRQKNKN